MSAANQKHLIKPDAYEAWLFDLDGVVTDTAGVHGAAWKKTFDDYLKSVAERDNVPFRPFEMDPDYFVYVDGKPRYDGVDSFLRSRGIELEWGTPEDPPTKETVCGIGNRKNDLFNVVLAEQGAEIFESSVSFIRDLRSHGVKTAVVSSSKNCGPVLKACDLTDLFDVQVDGIVAARDGLPGKPDPATFLAAAELLGVDAGKATVVEDAISGVQAGRSGGFGLVVGIARHDEPQALQDNGADIVVVDMDEMAVAT